MRYLVTAAADFNGKTFQDMAQSEHRSFKAALKKANQFWKDPRTGLVIFLDRETNVSTEWKKRKY